MAFEQQKLIRTIRLALTCLILLFILWYYQLPERIWCLMTIWFVMFDYTTIGGVYTKSLYRFVGTTASALFGLITIYCCANNVPMSIIAFLCALFIYAYFFMDNEKSYIAVIGSVTLSIVLLNHDSIDEAILRIFNIIIGIVGSMVMMRFFFPQYAKNEITDMQAKFIKQLSSMLISYLDPIKSLDTMKQEYLEHEHRLLTDFNTFNRLISEAKIETRKTPDFVQYHLSAMQHIRHIFRLMSVFICYLTTDEIRVNPWVCENLRQLLIAMQGVQQALSERTIHDLPEPLEDQIQDDTLQVILTDIHHELALFAEKIKHIVRISNTWKGRPHDSKA